MRAFQMLTKMWHKHYSLALIGYKDLVSCSRRRQWNCSSCGVSSNFPILLSKIVDTEVLFSFTQDRLQPLNLLANLHTTGLRKPSSSPSFFLYPLCLRLYISTSTLNDFHETSRISFIQVPGDETWTARGQLCHYINFTHHWRGHGIQCRRHSISRQKVLHGPM